MSDAPAARHEEQAPTPRLATVLLATFGGPIAWSLHLGICYFLVALDCATEWNGSPWAIGIATLLLALAAIATGMLAYRRWEGGRKRDESEASLDRPMAYGGFLWLLGMMLSGLFALVIILAGLSPIFLPTCA